MMAHTLLNDSDYYYANVGFNRFYIDRRYVSLQPLGIGSYGFVASAFDTILNRMVAIKKIKDTCEDILGGKRILRELKLLRHFCSHENVVTIRDIMTDPPNSIDFKDIYIVTDLFESDLEKIVSSRQTLTDQHYQFFLYQILRALKFVHSANVLHRDLKPSNFLVNSNCDLALCDFGLSRGFSGEPNEPLTEYVVTRWYRAPELLCCNSYYGKAVDVWSVGCIFAEMINRAPLFKGNGARHQLNEILKKIDCPVKEKLNFIQTKAAYNYVSKFQGKVGPHFSLFFPRGTSYLALDLLRKMLAFHPDERITVEEALQHPYLKDFHDEMPEPSCPRLFSFDFELTALHQFGLFNIKPTLPDETHPTSGSASSARQLGQVATSFRSIENHSTSSSVRSTLSGTKQKFQSSSAKSFDGNSKANKSSTSKTLEEVSSFLSTKVQSLSRTKRQKRSSNVSVLDDKHSFKGANYNPFPSLFNSNSNQSVVVPNPMPVPAPLPVYRSQGSGSSTELDPLTKEEVQQLIFNEVVIYRPFIINQYIAAISQSMIGESSRSMPVAVTPAHSAKSEYFHANGPCPQEQHQNQHIQAAPKVNQKTVSSKSLFSGGSATSLFRSTQNSNENVRTTSIFSSPQQQPLPQPASQNASSSKSSFSLGSAKSLFRSSQNDSLSPPTLNSNLPHVPQQQQQPANNQSSNSSKSFLGSGSAKSLFRGTSNEKSAPVHNTIHPPVQHSTQPVPTSNSSKSFSVGSTRSLFRTTASSDEKPPIGDKSSGRPVKTFLEGIVRSASLFKSNRNSAFDRNTSSHSVESQTSQNFGILDYNEANSQTAGVSGFSSKSLLSSGSDDVKRLDEAFSNMNDIINEMPTIESLPVSRRSSIFSNQGCNDSLSISISNQHWGGEGLEEILQHASCYETVEEHASNDAKRIQEIRNGDASVFTYSGNGYEVGFESEMGGHFFDANSSTEHSM